MSELTVFNCAMSGERESFSARPTGRFGVLFYFGEDYTVIVDGDDLVRLRDILDGQIANQKLAKECPWIANHATKQWERARNGVLESIKQSPPGVYAAMRNGDIVRSGCTSFDEAHGLLSLVSAS